MNAFNSPDSLYPHLTDETPKGSITSPRPQLVGSHPGFELESRQSLLLDCTHDQGDHTVSKKQTLWLCGNNSHVHCCLWNTTPSFFKFRMHLKNATDLNSQSPGNCYRSQGLQFSQFTFEKTQFNKESACVNQIDTRTVKETF